GRPASVVHRRIGLRTGVSAHPEDANRCSWRARPGIGKIVVLSFRPGPWRCRVGENRSLAERLDHVRGHVDLATVPGLRADLRRVINVEGVNLRIDCTHLTFIGAAGITALLETHEIL